MMHSITFLIHDYLLTNQSKPNNKLIVKVSPADDSGLTKVRNSFAS
jgi:hypothetical protein